MLLLLLLLIVLALVFVGLVYVSYRHPVLATPLLVAIGGAGLLMVVIGFVISQL
ncbi:hypothetical protein [Streptomyces sp. 35G-GA-8]|uniref:hypothetical protein n=1 Tax=Streptomyces sp. 35G-GA-8 TaxID=2939434 RepID=UPI00201EAD67|nr:hypothetical protein [Streptomyces sp. 35G-GA-8]MCL7379632.1 hypothetical protein [Streptomyces sp. 35G-GA-8]